MRQLALSVGLIITSSFAFAQTSPGTQPKAQFTCKSFSSAVVNGTPSQRLKRFFDVQWKYWMTVFPEYATYVGFPGQNDRWTDQSLKAIADRDGLKPCQLKALESIPRKSLSGEERVSFDLAVRDLKLDIEGLKFDSEYLALSHMDGIHIDLPDMLDSMPKRSVKDYENMLARLEKAPVLIDQTIVRMREGAKRKVTPLRLFLEKVPKQIDVVLTATPEESPLYLPFKEINPAVVSEADAQRIQKSARSIIADRLFPAFKNLKTYLVGEYIPQARETIAWTTVPNGKEWYAYLVKTHTTTDLTPEELHSLGLREVARIKAEMEKIKEKVGFVGDLKEFNRFLLQDDQFYYSSSQDLLTGYRDIGKRADAGFPKLFKRLPRLPYGVREMPAYKAASAPTAYYMGGSLESGRAGYFEANTYDLKARPKWGMEALTLHEAVPGHHLQISVAQELEGLPEFRKNGGHTAYVEGWGLYAESLGPEMGFFKDPYSKYGQLTYEIWRAIRLVIDTGIHSKGWTREQAIQYFLELAPKSQLEVEVEVDRYITWPGQALAYKVGELKFRELRERAKKELGDKFDVRSFHDEVLSHGSLPMGVLELQFNEWLQRQKKPPGHKVAVGK